MSIRSSPATLAIVGRDGRPVREANWLRRAVQLVTVWHQRARQRAHLRSLDERMLKDLGLGRADVELEVRKPFWHP